MTRSFGDKAGIKAGIIAIPEITVNERSNYDLLIVIGSDGLWDTV